MSAGNGHSIPHPDLKQVNRRVLVSALLLIAFGWGILVWNAKSQIDSREIQVREQSARLAKALQMQISQTLGIVDTTLDTLSDHIAERIDAPEEIRALLQDKSSRLPPFFSLVFIDARGIGVAATIPAYQPGISYADRDYFKAHAGNPQPGPLFGAPIEGRPRGRQVFTITRRIQSRDGHFLGVLLGAVEAKYLAAVFDEFPQGPNGAISLANIATQQIVARSPNHEKHFAQDISKSQLFNGLLEKHSCLYEVPTTTDGITRVIAYQQFESQPFVILVGHAREDLRAEFQKLIHDHLIAGTLLMFLVGVLAVSIARSQRRQHAIQLQLHENREELIVARDAAERASKAKSAFLASMSHELRTPLNAIIGFAQMLEMGVPAPLVPEQKEAVGHILGGGRHLLGLVNEVLDMARIEAGKLELLIETVPLRPLIDEAIVYTRAAAAARRIEIRPNCEACASCWQLQADRSRVKQILLNLLSNAVKYNRDGGLVAVTCDAAAAGARIAVADTGQGIAPEQQARLFEPFERLGAEQSATEGSGIGLVISQKLAAAMGGCIGFESDPGVGSRFWLEMPLAEPGSPDNPAAAPPAPASATSAAPPLRGRVLYVEDNPANASLMKSIFRQLPGVELRIAESAEAGLALIQQSRPDLVLMDINLPGMSGLEALRRLKSDPGTVVLPVVAITAVASPLDIRSGLDAGFLDYLTKPFDVPSLLSLIRRVLATAGVSDSVTPRLTVAQRRISSPTGS